MMAGIAGVACALVGLAALYLLFAGSVGTDECVAAALTAAAGSGWLALNRRATERHFTLAGPWHRIIGSTLLQLGADAGRVALVLARAASGARPSGTVSWQPFRYGGATPRDAGRRALATLAVSLAPNGYVLDLPGEADAMLLHRLAPAPAQPDREWPL